MKRIKSLEEWLEELAKRESSGNYSAVNPYGYLGKYQMGEGALADAGYYKGASSEIYQNWQNKFTGKDNVYSKEDFLNNPQAQENAIRSYMNKQWNYVKHYGYDKYVGSVIDGNEITPSGLLAGMHLKGHGGLGEYLKSNGQKKVADAYGTSITKYLKDYGGYDVSEITNPNYNRPKFDLTKQEKVDQVLNKNKDMMSNVADSVFYSEPKSINSLKNIPPQPPLSDEEWLERLRKSRRYMY